MIAVIVLEMLAIRNLSAVVIAVSVPGTRQVEKLLQVERYSHVMHLVSGVQGVLAAEADAFIAAAKREREVAGSGGAGAVGGACTGVGVSGLDPGKGVG